MKLGANLRRAFGAIALSAFMLVLWESFWQWFPGFIATIFDLNRFLHQQMPCITYVRDDRAIPVIDSTLFLSFLACWYRALGVIPKVPGWRERIQVFWGATQPVLPAILPLVAWKFVLLAEGAYRIVKYGSPDW